MRCSLLTPQFLHFYCILSKDCKYGLVKNELTSGAVVSKTRDGKEMVYLSFMPEIMDAYEDSEKEYEFIVDVSESMRGRKLDETKNAVIECLKQLDVGSIMMITGFIFVIAYGMGYINEKKAQGSIVPSWLIHAAANIFSGLCAAFMLI